MNDKFHGMNEQLKKTESEIRAANLEKIKPLTIKIVSELENLANLQAYDIPLGIVSSIKTSLENIRNTPYSIIRDIGNQEVESRLLKMRPKQQEAFKRLWKSLANELFGKVLEEAPGERKMLTKSERETVFISSIAEEWARRILGNYENHGQLNFGALLASMEKEFGTIPSLPGQLERGGSSKSIINALDELKDRIVEELGKITNQSQLETIKKEGALKKLEEMIESYKRMIRGGGISDQ